MMFVDALLASGLYWAGTQAPAEQGSSFGEARFWLKSGLIGLACFLILYSLLYVTGTWSAISGGDQVVLESPKRIGDVVVGDQRRVDVVVTNYSNAPVRLIGAQNSCLFRFDPQFPMVLEPGEHEKITFTFVGPNHRGYFSKRYYVFCDKTRSLRLWGVITGRSVDPMAATVAQQ